MSDTVRDYLKSKGYAAHVVRGGLNRLVEDWEQIVNSIMRGEAQEYYEYLNDMDSRCILEEALMIAPAELANKFRKRVADADQRVQAYLEETDDCIWGAEVAAKRGYTREGEWWYFHRPRNIDESWP
jgi:hypothetical protein